MLHFLVVTFAALTDPLTLQPQFGPFPTVESACGEDCQIRNRSEDGAFYRHRGEWYVALRGPTGWFTSRLPVQDAVTPHRVTTEGAHRRVQFEQHAYGPSVDTDVEWVWLCEPGACVAQPVPVSVRDRSNGSELEIESQVRVLPTRAGKWLVDVVFTRVKLVGPRAAEWRARIQWLRGKHLLP